MDLDPVTGLVVVDRKIGETALQKLLQNEKCTVVKLCDIRLDMVEKQAVAVVIFGRGKSRPAVSARESGSMYFITDLKGNTGSMELFYDAKQKFRGVPSISELEGTIVYLLNPKVTSDPQRPETLLFKICRQQDIVVIGKCPTLQRCDGIRRDGKNCTMPVDANESTRCKYHKEERKEYQGRMKSQRNEVTTANRERVTTSLLSSKSSPTCSKVTATSEKVPDMDILREALKPEANQNGLKIGDVKQKPSSACPLDDGDIDDDDQRVKGPQSLLENDLVSGGKRALTQSPLQSLKNQSLSSITDRKDGCVIVPKESKVFKVLSEAYYDQRAKENVARGASKSLHQVSITSSHAGHTSESVPVNNKLLSNRHSGIPGKNCLDSHNQKRKIDQTVRDKIQNFSKLRCVGGDLFDIDIARKNAKKQVAKVNPEEHSDVLSKRKQQLDREIEALLNRESSHSAEAEDEAFKVQMTRLDALSKREYMVQKDEKVHSLTVRAHHCIQCGEITETVPEKCRRENHTVQTISTLKRFYECTNCEKRESTLGGNVKLPKHACLRCGEYKWRPCGKRKTGFETSTRVTAAEKLVVSMSEGTAKYDVNRVACAKSDLDYIK